MICEFHFREGFAGEVVELTIAGERRMRRELRTRLQIGLAHIEEVRLLPGQEAAVTVPAAGLRAGIEVEETDRWITIDLEGGALVVRRAGSAPGYV
jgi:hypothetical protein